MDYKYQPGDAVLVRSDLKNNGTRYYMESGPRSGDANINVSQEMIRDYGGYIVHIARRIYSGFYKIKEDNEQWFWTDEMFVGPAMGLKFCSLL